MLGALCCMASVCCLFLLWGSIEKECVGSQGHRGDMRVWGFKGWLLK